jgi:hypothetical protein
LLCVISFKEDHTLIKKKKKEYTHTHTHPKALGCPCFSYILGRLSFVSVGSNKPKREKKNIIIKSGSTRKVDLEFGQPKALARFEVDKTRACN